MNIYTIGVYGSTEDSFFSAIKKYHIDTFCDIRQRRGVRGSVYSYVNSSYLQKKLSELGVRYLYEKNLAPTNDIRQKQRDDDKIKGLDKKSRTELGLVFKSEYINQILNNYDIEALVSKLQSEGTENIVFFCVEQYAKACHRSIVAGCIAKLFDYPVTYIDHYE